jgi:hypothetical protein
MSQPQHRLGDLASLRPGKAHHPDSAATRRSRDGDDRVVDIHGAIVAVKLGNNQRPNMRVEEIRGGKLTARARNLSVADELLKANEQFVKNFNLGDLAVGRGDGWPCSPAWIPESCLSAAWDCKPGDAHMIRNAGGIATEDALRSLIVSHHLLDTQEFIIINHTDCGLLKVREDEFKTAGWRRRWAPARASLPTFMRSTIWKRTCGSRCYSGEVASLDSEAHSGAGICLRREDGGTERS